MASYARPQDHNDVPKEGDVPDSETAAKFAAAVLVPVYGKRSIEGEMPFRVTRVEDGWIVEGTAKVEQGMAEVGGFALVKRSKKTGAILRMTPGK